MHLARQVFLGTLREIELERVKEKLSSAIMETCLALTIFREEFNMGFVGMFMVLTFVKVRARRRGVHVSKGSMGCARVAD
jgi:E3 ubiquitin-protein ligase synoviolin